MRQEPGVEVIWDDTGSRMTLITGLDGNKYFEGTHYSVIVNTATMPWQIDLSAKSTGGEAIAKKGIYELQEDTLRLSIGKAGNERPKTFDRQPLGSSDYIVMEATRVKSNK